MLVPIGGHAVNALRFADHLDSMAVVARMIATHMIAVDQVDATPFASSDQQMVVGPELVGEQKRATRAKVEVIGVERLLIEGREEIADREGAIGPGQF